MRKITECPVDINNEFCYNTERYEISSNLSQYDVKNFPLSTSNKYNNWTNECEMDSVIVIDNGGKLKFLDQDGTDITKHVVQV